MSSDTGQLKIIAICEKNNIRLSVNGTFLGDMSRLIAAEVAKGRKQLLGSLKDKAHEYGVPDVEMIERNGYFLNAIPVSVIESELQSLAGQKEETDGQR